MRNDNLTKKQMKILTLLKEFILQHGYPPSYRELANLMNLVSSSTVKQYLDTLRKKGYLSWEEGQPRTLHIIDQNEKSSAV
jgi:SOS-response transcriptional repressor LexA